MGHWVWKEATQKSELYGCRTILSRENFQAATQGGNTSGSTLLNLSRVEEAKFPVQGGPDRQTS